jgi:hypothetical protein
MDEELTEEEQLNRKMLKGQNLSGAVQKRFGDLIAGVMRDIEAMDTDDVYSMDEIYMAAGFCLMRTVEETFTPWEASYMISIIHKDFLGHFVGILLEERVKAQAALAEAKVEEGTTDQPVPPDAKDD